MLKYLAVAVATIASAIALKEMPSFEVVWLASVFSILQYVLYVALPGKSYLGPPDNGVQVLYKDNGMAAFVVTSVFAACHPFDIAATWKQWITLGNAIGLILVQILTYPAQSIKDWFCGTALHPLDCLNVDWKLFIASRLGMMGWAMAALNVIFDPEVTQAGIVSALLQYVYLARFFWWEHGYVYSMDQQHDRAGFYICWGCLSAVPMLYWLPLVYHHNATFADDSIICALLGFFGIVFQLLLYDVDSQKHHFRHTDGYEIWGSPCKFLVHTSGSRLLYSGWWGIARHSHYLFEVLSALCWCAPVGGYAYIYPAYLSVLLVHRCFRDEERCSAKYQETWNEYCKIVPYRIVPYIF